MLNSRVVAFVSLMRKPVWGTFPGITKRKRPFRVGQINRVLRSTPRGVGGERPKMIGKRIGINFIFCSFSLTIAFHVSFSTTRLRKKKSPGKNVGADF